MQRDHIHGGVSKHAGAGPGTNDPNKAMMGLLEQVQNEAGARSPVGAADAVAAVFSGLLAAVRAASARSFVESMPPSLRSLLHGAAYTARRPEAEITELAGLLAPIAAAIRIDSAAAEALVRDVAAAAWVWLPREKLESLRQELPPDIRPLLRPR